MRRCCKRPNPDPNPNRSVVKHDPLDSGYTVDLEDLLFTNCRYFLIRNNGKKVWVDDLKGKKTIVLYIVPINLHSSYMQCGDTLDVIQAYHELLPLGGTEFVFVPVYLPYGDKKLDPRARFDDLFSAIPFPVVPFSDARVCGDRVVNTFSVTRSYPDVSYWVIIDPTGTVVATRAQYCFLFKHFGGAELYPLSLQRISYLLYEFDRGDGRESRYSNLHDVDDRLESRKLLIRGWDRLLASPGRDFLLSGNGGRVPISSLRGKVVGLYFCDNVPRPPRMEVIKEAYRDARSRGYDFEIVHINYHYTILEACHPAIIDYSERQRYENIDWLMLPFKDPSCRKLQRIFKCKYDSDAKYYNAEDWEGDCLVIIDDSRARDDKILFEFCGAEIIEKYGIEAYPFTRRTIHEAEYTRLKKEVKLQLLFPPGLCQFIRPVASGGFDLVSDSQLKEKRVLVLFACRSRYDGYDHHYDYLHMLKSKYRERAEEDKFELIYVSTNRCDSDFIQGIQDMPWLVHPYSEPIVKWCTNQIFKAFVYDYDRFVAFDIDGQLIFRGIFDIFPVRLEREFPFLRGDLRGSVRKDLRRFCNLGAYYGLGRRNH